MYSGLVCGSRCVGCGISGNRMWFVGWVCVVVCGCEWCGSYCGVVPCVVQLRVRVWIQMCFGNLFEVCVVCYAGVFLPFLFISFNYKFSELKIHFTRISKSVVVYFMVYFVLLQKIILNVLHRSKERVGNYNYR